MSIKPELLKDEKEIRKAAEDCIFVHLRIGDLMVAEEHFEGAEREYTIAAALGLRFRLNLSAILPAIIARAQTQLYQGRGAEAVVMFKAALEIAEKCLSGTNENASIPSTSNIADYEATIEDLKVQIEETENNIESGMFNGPIVPPEAAETHRQTLIKLAGLDSSKKGFDQSSSELTKEGIVQLGVVKSKRKRDEDESESRVKKAKEGDAKDNNDTA